jgi:pantoate--beta-alanine ligase
VDILETPPAAQRWSGLHRRDGRRIGFVPTMGALHEGHLRLVEVARERTTVVVVSIFVNPIQFNQRSDFESYPRPEEDDHRLLAEAGIDALYLPSAAVMYPPGFQTYVDPGPLGEPMEGTFRPGHFRGVATVVTKLFLAVRPDVAVFGEKDYQQLAIIRRMTADLDLGIEVVGVPTVREADGVAMSSRNRRLTPDQRAAARCIPDALAAAQAKVAAGARRAALAVAAVREVVGAEPSARLEYAEVCDPVSLERVDLVTAPCVLALAVWIGEVRLIDNVTLVPRDPSEGRVRR